MTKIKVHGKSSKLTFSVPNLSSIYFKKNSTVKLVLKKYKTRNPYYFGKANDYRGDNEH